jgi:hypothetical protein
MIDPDRLSPEQRKLWRELGMDCIKRSGEQTMAQARRTQEAAFRAACALEGIPLGDALTPRRARAASRTLHA